MEDTTMADASQGMFSDLKFIIIPTALPDDRLRRLTDDITANGGDILPFDTSSGRVESLAEITHIISTTSDFPDYQRANDLYKHVVQPSWVTECLKAGKIKNPRGFNPDPALFMSDVVVCAADIPEADQEAIEGGVLAMGGQWTRPLSKMVTHIIALTLDNDRCQLAIAKRLRCAIVLPHWFDDCLKLGRRISERPYTLPNPPILNPEAGAIPHTRPSPQIRDATNPEPTHNPTPSAHLEPTRSIKAFEGKKVMLADDLGLTEGLRDVIKGLIRAGGGEVTTNVDNASVYVCNFRDGEDYVKASQARKDVGNLSWLYYLIAHDSWTNPMRRMLHYPRPKNGVPGFEGYKISISSYTGEARIYLENLIKASGAEFTKTFKQDNTHLITAHQHSEKCEAAQEWNVHVVNHLWLEESYAKCKEQTLTDERYNYFPTRTNLGEILGQTEIDRNSVELAFFPKARKADKATKLAAQKDAVPGSSAPKRVATEVPARSSPLVEKNRRTKTETEAVTPLPSRRKDDKENETPGTTSSRGAKDRALTKLHDSATDIAQFEKEMKRKGGVIHGGRRQKEDGADDESKVVKGRESIASKRSIDEVDDEGSTSEDEAQGEPTNRKKAKLTPIKFRMLVSKDLRWENNTDKEGKDKSKLRELGLFITEDARKVNLLCAPKVVRTRKFVSALATGPTLVSSSYLDYALKYNKLPPPEKHLLKDREFEKVHGIVMDEAVERAKQNRGHLLKNWTIYCTDVRGGFDTYRDIIVANGGKPQKYTGRNTNVTASKRSIDRTQIESQNQEEDEGDVLYLISESSTKDQQLWPKFRELAKTHDMIPRIVRTEWLLFVAMAQYVHWDPEWELTE
ncbi:hypothetical protein EJ04DRAFT_544288 [Polyplosphaeria fusca]|uniref:BRCT domain-containing protein n=1 Tax=Polyplosphaeria fusca TaxID=682080 RepID=A0A9P4V082_9PLEO|nr:hypothetical protein EJ04DRAFT_544288 [Polyplosphaeria fusca]